MFPILRRENPATSHGRKDASRERRNRSLSPCGEGLERIELLSTFAVSGQANIYGAGLAAPPAPGGGGGGVLPVSVNLSTLGSPKILNFPTVTGTVSGWAAAGGYNGPDGGPNWGGVTNVPAYKGISGIIDSHATMFLVGVFLGPNGQPANAPTTLNVSNDKTLTSFTPLIGQQFMIGDGRTGSQALQSFNVPSGATKLYLGFAEGYGFGNPKTPPGFYSDNGGTLKVDVQAGPTTDELYAGAVAAYGLSEGTFAPPVGWKNLAMSPLSQRADGFAAVAVRDPNGNLIILNEGTVPGTSLYDREGLRADLSISGGKVPAALNDAAAFALTVQKQYGGTVYVAGHSLGGVEAEMECKALGANCGGGATFGATGLPGNTDLGPSTLENFVDYGDPVGNASSDPSSPLASLFVNINMRHFGKVTMVGSPSDVRVLESGAALINADLAATDSWATTGTFGGQDSDGSVIGGLVELSKGLKDHAIANYGADLNLTQPAGAQSPTLDEFLAMAGIPYGRVGFANLQNAVVQSDGSLVSPAFTLSFGAGTGQVVIRQTAKITGSWGTTLAGGVTTIVGNPSTGLPAILSYASPDRTTYFATLDPGSERFKTLQVNQNNGGSYEINYDLSNSKPWSLNVVFFKGLNGRGTDFQVVSNWDAGGSQIKLINPSSAVATRFNTYAGLNGSGALTQVTLNWIVGGSQIQTFADLPPGYSKKLRNYSGPNGTGTLLSTVYVQ